MRAIEIFVVFTKFLVVFSDNNNTSNKLTEHREHEGLGQHNHHQNHEVAMFCNHIH